MTYNMLDQLDKKNPNYTRRLDDVIGALLESGLRLERNITMDVENHRNLNNLKAYLENGGIEGVEIREDSSIEIKWDPSKVSKRAIKNAVRDYTREFEDSQSDLADEKEAIKRELKDFIDAALELTEITQLGEITKGTTGHGFYVVRGDQVYEAHVFTEPGELLVCETMWLNPDLTAEEMERQKERNDSRSGGILGPERAVYIATNPVTMLEPQELMFQLIEHGKAEYEKVNKTDSLVASLMAARRNR